MIFVFDCETTGFYDDKLPIGHPDQAEIVQLAGQLCDETTQAPVAMFSLLVKPTKPIPDHVSRIHGITNEIVAAAGVPPPVALSVWKQLYVRATLAVAHNIAFDKMAIEALICQVTGVETPLTRPLFCTMEAAASLLRLEASPKQKQYHPEKPWKSPRLEECMQLMFGETHDKAHNALADVDACRRVYFFIRRETDASHA